MKMAHCSGARNHNRVSGDELIDRSLLLRPALSFEHDILLGMSMFKVNVVARNPKQEELETQPIEALVDTGWELTWLPGEILQSVGITPRRKRVFAKATQQKIEREVGYAILSAEGYET